MAGSGSCDLCLSMKQSSEIRAERQLSDQELGTGISCFDLHFAAVQKLMSWGNGPNWKKTPHSDHRGRNESSCFAEDSPTFIPSNCNQVPRFDLCLKVLIWVLRSKSVAHCLAPFLFKLTCRPGFRHLDKNGSAFPLGVSVPTLGSLVFSALFIPPSHYRETTSTTQHKTDETWLQSMEPVASILGDECEAEMKRNQLPD